MTRPARPTFRPAVEALEARDVPATLVELTGIAQRFNPPPHDPAPTTELAGRDLVITGTAGDDIVTVSRPNRGTIRVDVRTGTGPVASRVVSAAAIDRIVFHGGDGDDVFANRTAVAS